MNGLSVSGPLFWQLCNGSRAPATDNGWKMNVLTASMFCELTTWQADPVLRRPRELIVINCPALLMKKN